MARCHGNRLVSSNGTEHMEQSTGHDRRNTPRRMSADLSVSSTQNGLLQAVRAAQLKKAAEKSKTAENAKSTESANT